MRDQATAGALMWDDGSADRGAVFGLPAAATAELGAGFSGHSGRVGMARRMTAAGEPTHESMAQGGWKTARMVEVHTRGEMAGVGAGQNGDQHP